MIKYIEVIPNFLVKPGSRFFVPIGEKYGNQLQSALDNGWTVKN